MSIKCHRGSPFSDEVALVLQRDIFANEFFLNQIFGEVKRAKLNDLVCVSALKKHLRENKIDRIVFSNPYRDEEINSVYSYCRANGFPLLVIERGCLPGSVFLDTCGFLLDSEFYEMGHWNKPIKATAETSLANFLDEYHAGLAPLETQKTTERLDVLPEQFSDDTRPIILITLQIPADTATTSFVEGDRDYASFMNFLELAVKEFGHKYRFVYKTHPNYRDLRIAGAERLSGVHIYDALSACDALITFNSGTGVLGFLHDKPVAIYGRAFYGDEGLTHSLENLSDLGEFLNGAGESFDKELRKRFLVHLRENLYSDVQFLSVPFWKKGVCVALSFETVRVFNCVMDKVSVLNFNEGPSTTNTVGRQIVSYMAAAKRWALNRLGM